MYTLDEIRAGALAAASQYNKDADPSDRIVRIDLFGSYASDRQTEDSDVDFLVEFASPSAGLFSLARALDLLERQFSCPVDMVASPLPDGSLLRIERTVPLYEAA